jgi:hypothetical protein
VDPEEALITLVVRGSNSVRSPRIGGAALIDGFSVWETVQSDQACVDIQTKHLLHVDANDVRSGSATLCQIRSGPRVERTREFTQVR